MEDYEKFRAVLVAQGWSQERAPSQHAELSGGAAHCCPVLFIVGLVMLVHDRMAP